MNEIRKDGKPGAPCGPGLLPLVGDRRLAIGAVKLWGILTLSLTATLSAFAIWHLVRRGRLLRESRGPVKNVRPLEDPEIEVSGPL